MTQPSPINWFTMTLNHIMSHGRSEDTVVISDHLWDCNIRLTLTGGGNNHWSQVAGSWMIWKVSSHGTDELQINKQQIISPEDQFCFSLWGTCIPSISEIPGKHLGKVSTSSLKVKGSIKSTGQQLKTHLLAIDKSRLQAKYGSTSMQFSHVSCQIKAFRGRTACIGQPA